MKHCKGGKILVSKGVKCPLPHPLPPKCSPANIFNAVNNGSTVINVFKILCKPWITFISG